ncbi:MAG TPA: CoA transferase [Iamia sp.]|nr:CoA transferase [Iamia sp.]
MRRWAASGAMALTGDADGPPLAPPTTAALVLDARLAPFGLDGRVLGERAALLGRGRQGSTSCGGSARLLRGRDGWLALSLPRPSDVDLLPALLGVADTEDPWPDDPWPAVARAVADRDVAEVEADAVTLGLAVAAVGGSTAQVAVRGRARAGDRGGPAGAPRVVDLSALWAGPLCADLLRRGGAEVVKVESVGRPDGARSGVAAFYDLVNEQKASVAVDLATAAGRAVLRGLVDAADIVVTSARARAIHHLGLDPSRFLAGGTDRVWVAITGHGWDVDRVGFGDDAAAAAGLVAWGDDGCPRFAGDAVADPVGGVVAAAAATRAWGRGGRWFVDAPLAGAARLVTPSVPVPATAAVLDDDGRGNVAGEPVRAPHARRAGTSAAALGADTARALAAWTS